MRKWTKHKNNLSLPFHDTKMAANSNYTTCTGVQSINTEKVHLKTIPQHSPMPSSADILLSKLVFDFSSFGKQNNAMQLTKKKRSRSIYSHTCIHLFFTVQLHTHNIKYVQVLVPYSDWWSIHYRA